MKRTPRVDAAGLVVTLEAEPSYGPDEPVTLRFRVRNPGFGNRVFCLYHTPFEGFRNDIFRLQDGEGREMDYRGCMARRVAPGLEDFVQLTPGQETSTEVDLREGYPLGPGTYRVAFTGNGVSGLPASPAVEFRVVG